MPHTTRPRAGSTVIPIRTRPKQNRRLVAIETTSSASWPATDRAHCRDDCQMSPSSGHLSTIRLRSPRRTHLPTGSPPRADGLTSLTGRSVAVDFQHYCMNIREARKSVLASRSEDVLVMDVLSVLGCIQA